MNIRLASNVIGKGKREGRLLASALARATADLAPGAHWFHEVRTVQTPTVQPVRSASTGRPATTTPEVEVDRQHEVIVAPADAKLLVLAPPGTGKTWVIIERLLVLAGKSTRPGTIRMLAFTKAAAHEMSERYRHRIAGMMAAPNFPTFGTLDSFCGDVIQILRQDSGRDLTADSHDGSIDLLVGIAEGRMGPDLRRRFEILIPNLVSHLIVDEIQDVVHLRARLVLHLASLVGGHRNGMLLAGDLRQAIYNTSDTWNDRVALPTGERMDAFAFAEALAGIPSMRRVELTKSWRYKTEGMRRFIGGLQATMDAAGAWPGQRPDVASLRGFIASGLDVVDHPSMLDPNGRIAVLARDNPTVQRITSRLITSMAGRMRVRAISDMDGNGYPGWLGRVFRDQAVLDHAAFLDAHLKRVQDDIPLAEQRWRMLVHLTGSDSPSVNRLIGVIRNRRDMSTDMRESAKSGEVVVSTIHKAKGLEFEQVVVFDPDRIQLDRVDEARLLYVALTRATTSIAACSGEAWHHPAATALEAKDADLGWYRMPEVRGVLAHRQERLWRAWTHAEPLQVHHGSQGIVEIRMDGHPLARWRPKSDDRPVRQGVRSRAMIADMRSLLLEGDGEHPVILVPHVVLEKVST